MKHTIHTASFYLGGQEKIEEEKETVEVLGGTSADVSGFGYGWATDSGHCIIQHGFFNFFKDPGLLYRDNTKYV